MRADIIIPQYNNAEYSVNLLKSIYDCTQDYRIIFIDNGSEPDELELAKKELERHPHFLIENPENLGFVKGVNQGIASSTADYVVLQNNDTLVEPFWLDKLISTFAEDSRIGLVGPLTEMADSWQNKENFKEKFFESPYHLVSTMIAFFCTVIKRDVITKVGYLSEEFGLGFGDDDDYCARARQAGFFLAVRTDVTVPHFHRTTFKKYIPEWEKGKAINQKIINQKYPEDRSITPVNRKKYRNRRGLH